MDDANANADANANRHQHQQISTDQPGSEGPVRRPLTDDDDDDDDPGMLPLRFATLRTSLDTATYHHLHTLKLNTLRLSEDWTPIDATISPSRFHQVPATIYYTAPMFPAQDPPPPPLTTFDVRGSEAPPPPPSVDVPFLSPPASGPAAPPTYAHARLPARVAIYNTREAFRHLDRVALTRDMAASLWSEITSGSILADPSRASPVYLTLFVDAKHHVYESWSCVPALVAPTPFLTTRSTQDATPRLLAVSHLALQRGLLAWAIRDDDDDDHRHDDGGDGVEGRLLPLTSLVSDLDPSRLVLGVMDPTGHPDVAGWPLRNLLLALSWAREEAATTTTSSSSSSSSTAAAAAAAGGRSSIPTPTTLRVLSVRLEGGVVDAARSNVRTVTLPPLPADWLSPTTSGPDEASPDPLPSTSTKTTPSTTTTTTTSTSTSTPTTTTLPVRAAPAGSSSSSFAPPCVGWEIGPRGRPGPLRVDLSQHLDPSALAESSLRLNLSLMRWRAVPSLPLDYLASQRVLILGVGTLGCAVARTCLGWGITRLTLVDQGRVSASNPVRQSLFTFAQAHAHAHALARGSAPGAGAGLLPALGAWKVDAAVETLRAIHPGVEARGVALSIPMPGHPVHTSETSEVRRDIERLEALIVEHDVVFLLTDSRESRWLPTLLATATDTLLVNAAIGFDAYVVMRHGRRRRKAEDEPPNENPSTQTPTDSAATQREGGVRVVRVEEEEGGGGGGGERGDDDEKEEEDEETEGEKEPGCYFCTDVVAPQDSMTQRTLDQQCTVSRPGLAAVAGALAVELMVNTVITRAHRRRHHEPETVARGSRSLHHSRSDHDSLSGSSLVRSSSAKEKEKAGFSAMGPAVHSIRGRLHGFAHAPMSSAPFGQCTACSPRVVTEWRRRGADMVLQVANDPQVLEQWTGLDRLAAEVEAMELAAETAAETETNAETKAEEAEAEAEAGGSADDEWCEL